MARGHFALKPNYASLSKASRLDLRSQYLRELVVEAAAGGKRGHIGPALSLIEIIRVLYDDVMRYDPQRTDWPERDRFILSKGHGCLALYAVLADKGFFPREELARQCEPDAMLGGHPERGMTPGVEASTGALGHGLSIGVGMAIGLRLKKKASRVYVVMGDGEVNEGAIWEAAMSASKHHLANLIAFMDYNKLQSYGPIETVMPLEPLADKWRAFGFNVIEVNGHNVQDLMAGIAEAHHHVDGPSLLICHTVKGKGVAIAEHNPDWHHRAKVTAEDAEMMRASLRQG